MKDSLKIDTYKMWAIIGSRTNIGDEVQDPRVYVYYDLVVSKH